MVAFQQFTYIANFTPESGFFMASPGLSYVPNNPNSPWQMYLLHRTSVTWSAG